jgi:hypothetical protein
MRAGMAGLRHKERHKSVVISQTSRLRYTSGYDLFYSDSDADSGRIPKYVGVAAQADESARSR